MKTLLINYFYIFGVILLMAFILQTKITSNPFSVSFENWRTVLGIILIFIGIEIVSRDAVRKYKDKINSNITEAFDKTFKSTNYEKED